MSRQARALCSAALLGAVALCGVLTACRDNAPPRDPRTGEAGRSAASGEGGVGGAGSSGGSGGTGGLAAAGSGGAAATGGNAGAAGEGGRGGSSPLPEPNVNAILKGGCATFTMKSELVPSNLLFVIDRSASMACNPPPITDSMQCEVDQVRADPDEDSKWEVMSEALLSAIGGLSQETVVGISYFSNDDKCGVQSTPTVELAPLSDAPQLGAIQASLFNVEPRGATPLVGGVILAYSHMHKRALAGAIRGKKFVVLLTDGEQSEACSDEGGRCIGQAQCSQLLDDEAKKAAGPGVGIRTFVIGVPGSEPARTVLSKLAQSGDTALPGCDPTLGNCHFDMTMHERLQEALRQALNEISGRALTCELPLPKPDYGEVDPKRVNVVYSPNKSGEAPSIVPQDARYSCDDSSTNGWQYIDDQTKIRLCGQICKTVRADRGARLDVVLGCEVQGPI